MEKNNLFGFATSELSQDAFICWLLNFAHKDHLDEDSVLTECAKEILAKILPDEPNLLITADIERQYKKTDILIEVNEKHNIIIEDKTFSNVHDDQIKRYEKELKAVGRQNIKCVYYKIVEQAHDEKDAINIKRNDLIDIFRKYKDKTENTILKDYYDYLLFIDKDVNSYKNFSIADWRDKKHTYKGFFTHLVQNNIIQTKEDSIINGNYNWKYISNPRCSFWGLWWYSIREEVVESSGLKNNGINEMYLQIEEYKTKDTENNDKIINIIAIKIVGDKNFNQSTRKEIFNFCNNFCKNRKEPAKFEKKKFRNGGHLTLGYIEYDETNYKDRIELMQNLMQSIVNDKYKNEN